MADRKLRMPDINSIQIAGNLTRDPEVKTLPSGQTLCKLGIAHSRKYKDKEETCFINVVVWGNSAEWCGQHLKKGYPVHVDGRLNQNTWQDAATGENKSMHEIVASRVQGLAWDSIAGIGNQRDETEPESDGEDLPF